MAISNMERCGDFAINRCMGRPYVDGHKHDHDHVTQATAGWTLVQMLAEDRSVIRETQIAARQYVDLRRMQEKHEPHLLTFPWRLRPAPIKLIDPNNPEGPPIDSAYLVRRVAMLRRDQPAPEGAEPIPFEPFGAEVEILKGARHALHWLAPESDWNCIFTWRDPATGQTVNYFTGWGAS